MIEQLKKTIKELEEKLGTEKNQSEVYRLQREIKTAYRTITYLENPQVFYNSKYFNRHFTQYREWEKKLAQDLVKRYHIESLVDFGCGCGSYLEGAKELGVKVHGFEYMYDIIKDIVDPEVLEFIEYADCMEPIEFGPYDCAMSIEVAEHIVPEKSPVFVKNIADAANRIVFFTAARPGQGGTGHINCQRKAYWKELFESNGYFYDDDETNNTTDLWCRWLKREQRYLINNLMIFFKYDK